MPEHPTLQGEEDALFVDPAVYSRNRAFRLYLSSKFGKQVGPQRPGLVDFLWDEKRLCQNDACHHPSTAPCSLEPAQGSL